MQAAINTIRNHAETIRETIDIFHLDGEFAKCSTQINASIREIQAKMKYLEFKANDTKD